MSPDPRMNIRVYQFDHDCDEGLNERIRGTVEDETGLVWHCHSGCECDPIVVFCPLCGLKLPSTVSDAMKLLSEGELE